MDRQKRARQRLAAPGAQTYSTRSAPTAIDDIDSRFAAAANGTAHTQKQKRVGRSKKQLTNGGAVRQQSRQREQAVDVDGIIRAGQGNRDLYNAEIQTREKLMEMLTKKCSGLQIKVDSAHAEIAQLQQQMSAKENEIAPVQERLHAEIQEKENLQVLWRSVYSVPSALS